jgi:hypothetical protein
VYFELCKSISANISRVVVGKSDCIGLMLVGLFAEGHVLIDCAVIGRGCRLSAVLTAGTDREHVAGERERGLRIVVSRQALQ